MMQLAHPEYLWLFLIFIPLIGWYVWKHRTAYPALEISTTAPYAKLPRSYKEYLLHGLFLLRLATIGCLIIVLARPQTSDNWRTSSIEGTDIVIALDISTSMLARDFTPDRFEAAKDVAAKFTSGRDNDNMGLVIFAGESFTLLPMTTDRAMVANYIHEIKMGMLDDGTAIGDGLATSINRIKDGKAKSKSVILITDGTNNTGVVPPLTAAEIAKKYGIKVYTIGVGTNGTAPTPVSNYFGRRRTPHHSVDDRRKIFPRHRELRAERHIQRNRPTGKDPDGRAPLLAHRGRLYDVGVVRVRTVPSRNSAPTHPAPDHSLIV